jgi:hypothetical protein|tara:strand:+ start:365 stop:1318 length:954 start_codon:yes stop_codon:yes gene_type:complete
MKKLYEFAITKVEPVVKRDTTTNEKGEKVTTEKSVDSKVKHQFFLRKPTRSLYDEAELFYGIELSKGIKAGLLTKALLAKRYENDGGSLSDGEIERYGNLYLDFYRRTDEYQKLLIKDEENLTEEDRADMERLERELTESRSTLTQFEMEQQSLYEQTAEVRARNKTILWWILQLSYGADNNAYFPGKTFEERLSVYDELSEEEDIFTNTVIQRLTYFVSFWFVGRASTQEEFDAMLREQGLEEQDLDAEEELPAMEAAEEIRDIVLESVVSEEKPKEEEPEVKPKKSKKTKKKAPVKKEPKSDDNPEEPAEKQETE